MQAPSCIHVMQVDRISKKDCVVAHVLFCSCNRLFASYAFSNGRHGAQNSLTGDFLTGWQTSKNPPHDTYSARRTPNTSNCMSQQARFRLGSYNEHEWPVGGFDDEPSFPCIFKDPQ